MPQQPPTWEADVSEALALARQAAAQEAARREAEAARQEAQRQAQQVQPQQASTAPGTAVPAVAAGTRKRELLSTLTWKPKLGDGTVNFNIQEAGRYLWWFTPAHYA